MNAKQFVEKLKSWESGKEYEKITRYFPADDIDNRVIGVRMKKIFDLAKENTGMPLEEVVKLLDEPYYEARMGAVSIMDFKARQKQITEEDHKKLFDLYLNRHNRINSWDFVDRSAPHVIGAYLYKYKKSRDILFKLAESGDLWERRTSIVATGFFIRKGEPDDTFRIAEILVHDVEEMVQKAIGTWIRHAGQQAPDKLHYFLENYAAGMPRPTLTIAMEKLEKKYKDYYRSLEKNG